MSEWSDEACRAFWEDHSRTDGNGMSGRWDRTRSALRAADAVRKWEAGEKQEPAELRAEFIKLQSQVILLTKQFDRRLPALEAARQPEPPKPEPERRCGTCRWFSDEHTLTDNYGLCEWNDKHPTPSGYVPVTEVIHVKDPRFCILWEAEHVE